MTAIPNSHSGEIAETAALVAANSNPKPIRHNGQAVVDRADLAYAVNVVKGVVEKRHTIPILSNVLLIASADDFTSPNHLAVVATDLDLEIRVEIAGAVDDGFGLTVPACLIESFLKNAPKSEMVAMISHGERADEGTMQAASLDFERARYDVIALPVADFPHLEPGEFSHRYTMPGAVFFDMLDSVRVAISTEETRYYLNGIFWHVHASGNQHLLRAVATDGHRAYRQEIEALDDGMLDMPSAIIPRKTVEYLLKLMKGKACPATVAIEHSSTKMRFRFGRVTVTSKLVDGTFPDYQRVIPTGNSRIATFDRNAMQEAASAVSAISSERGRAFKILIEEGVATLSVVNPDAGRAECSIPCTLEKAGEDSPSIEIGFNAKYIDQMLDDIGAGDVTAEFEGPGSPAVFHSAKAGWLAVLMPTRI